MSRMADYHDEEITAERERLEGRIAAAASTASSSLRIVRHLASDAIYDVEFAEGDGSIERLLETAVAALKGAEALVQNLNRMAQ